MHLVDKNLSNLSNLSLGHRGFVITRTPFRVSFFGGGTDVPSHFEDAGGAVLGAAINKYIYVTMNSLERLLDKKIRFSYSKLEIVDSPEELQHALAKTILTGHVHFETSEFLDIHTFADLPSSSGIGSSSTFTVGMLNALYLLNGRARSPELLAQEAIEIERVKLKEAGGWQDQYFAAYGGFNVLDFSKTGDVTCKPIVLTKQKLIALQAACVMVFTGGVRSSSDIQQHFKKTDQDKKNSLMQLASYVPKALDILQSAVTEKEMIAEFGRLLHESWLLKRSLSKHISNHTIDAIYQMGLNAGAYGGKICGAGGGGFILFIVPPEQKENLKKSLGQYHPLDLMFDSAGSRPIFYQAE